MRLTITDTLTNIYKIQAEVAGRSDSQRKLELIYKLVCVPILCLPIIVICGVIFFTDWNVKPVSSIGYKKAFPQTYTQGGTIDEGYLINENKHYAPVLDSYDRTAI